ncbi:MAG: RDD family protein, partial [Pseudonocardiaceae bacterium]
RVISCLIDYVAPVIVLNLLISLGVALGSPTWPVVLGAVGYLGLLGFGIWNSGYLQGTTGQSLGRRVARTKLVAIETGQPVGFGSAMARQICHGVEFGIGYLWPLWDGKRQTFADKISNTVVIRVDSPTVPDATTEDRTGSTTP